MDNKEIDYKRAAE
jgi:putative transposase